VGRYVWNRRQLRRIGLTAVVVVLAVGAWQGVAGATATGGKTEKIQHHNANCGRSIGTPPIGTAKFKRDGNSLSVDVNLTSAEEDSDFLVDLYLVKPNGSCKFVDEMGKIETDGAGMGHGSYESQVDPKSHKFFVDILREVCTDESTSVQPCDGGGAPTKHGPNVSPVDNDSLIAEL